MSDLTLSSLAHIRTKVRRLTRSPSTAQITDANIDNYINTFVLYDFPEELRLFTLRKKLTFFAEPYIDTYETNTANPNSPLYNFLNTYISIHPPVFIAGYRTTYTQSEDQFYGVYPKINAIKPIGTGDGFTVNFVGTLGSVPILQDLVLFSSVDATGSGITLIDNPINNNHGHLIDPNDDPTILYGTINYITGVYNFTFPVAPDVGRVVNAQTVPYVPSRPLFVLYYDNKIILRPVPDQPYRIEFEAYKRPTELLAVGSMPELSEWWQYIAYGASKKVFEDRMDQESVQLIMPEFKHQESLILRRTIMQQSNERTATIYTEQVSFGPGKGSGWGDSGAL